MKFLADVNVIFPLLLSRHSHREAALKWFDSTSSGEIALCRLVRLGVLRLLSSAKVMGPDVLTPKLALQVLHMLEQDDRIVLASEPQDLDAELKSLAGRCATTPNLWTDVYLAAFAKVGGLKLVSFDRGFSKFGRLPFLTLTSE